MKADLSIGHAVGPRPGAVADAAPAQGPLAASLAGLVDGWRAWRHYRTLRAMSGAGLARLGLEQGDIARHAVLAAADPGGPDPSAATPGLSYEAVEHELKTPLTSMRSLAEILLDCPDLGEVERRRFLAVLVEENERLGRTVERLLGDPGLRRALG